MSRSRGRLRAAALVVAGAVVLVAPTAPSAREIDCPALLAHVQTITGLLEKARLLDTAAEKCPLDAAVAYEHAFALERLRRYPEALTAYRSATELEPRHGKAHIGLGDVLMQLGDPAGAVAAYERGLALDQRNERARKALDLARIKSRAQRGEDISAEEFSQVMTQAEAKGGPVESAEGPLVRMQILFKLGSATLDAAALGKLKVVGQALRGPALARARLEITGHTDAAGNPDDNLTLSKSRAEAVRQHLMSRHQIQAERLVVSWFGQSRPVRPDTTPENRQLNRRVEFRLVK